MKITAIVEDRVIKTTVDGNRVYGRGLDKLEYQLDDEWKVFDHLVAWFESGKDCEDGKAPNVPVELEAGKSSGEVSIPEIHAGKLRITFHGYDTEDGPYLKTARMARGIVIERHGKTTFAESEQPIELIARLTDVAEECEGAAASANSAAASADASATLANSAAFDARRMADVVLAAKERGDFNGKDGDPGAPGDDGFSPSATVTKSGKVATITITDKDGTTTATVSDGEDGAPGRDGTLITLYSDGNGIYDREGGDLLTFAQIQAIMAENGNNVAVNIGDTWIGYYSYMALDAIAWSNCLLLDGASYNLRLIINDQNQVKESEEIVVSDVRINGTSITQDGVANIPYGTNNNHGVVRGLPELGTSVNANGYVYIQQANNSAISNRDTAYRPITPNTLDYAVKAAMTDGKGAAWTDAEKLAARERMGLGGDFELIEEITLSDSVSRIDRSATPSGRNYKFSNVAFAITVPKSSPIFGSFIWCNESQIARYAIANNNDYVQEVGCSVNIINGRAFCAGTYTALNAKTNAATPIGMPQGMTGMDMDEITSIAFTTYNGSITAGTTIKIYGAWA